MTRRWYDKDKLLKAIENLDNGSVTRFTTEQNWRLFALRGHLFSLTGENKIAEQLDWLQ